MVSQRQSVVVGASLPLACDVATSVSDCSIGYDIEGPVDSPTRMALLYGASKRPIVLVVLNFRGTDTPLSTEKNQV